MNDTQIPFTHFEALVAPKGVEKALLRMYEGIALYFEYYNKETESYIGEDAVLGEAAESLVFAFRRLLDGPTGRLEPSELENKIISLAMEHRVKID